MRLDAVELLVHHQQHHPTALAELGNTLKKCADLDKMLTGISIVPKAITTKTAKFLIDTSIMLIQVTRQLHAQLSTVYSDNLNNTNPLWSAILSNLVFPDMGEISTHIHEFISDSTTYTKSSLEMKHQECFAIKPGIGHFFIYYMMKNNIYAANRY